MTSNGKRKDQNIAGFDPAQYRRMTIMFVTLSLINVVFVILAFLRTGYGLYHAEEALSRVSKVTQCVHSVNECAQDVLINCEDRDEISQQVAKIDELFSTIDEKSEEYRSIELKRIDKDLKLKFDSASLNVTYYQHALKDFTDDLVANGAIDPAHTAETYDNLIEPMKVNAENSMNDVFTYQSEATQKFFFRSAQQFLFVLLFLFVTMTVGIIGISRMRKNARIAAEAVEAEHQQAQKMRAKTVDIAYTNILTGFKNYYGMEKDLAEKVGAEDIYLAVFRYCKFSQINEMFGRGRTDEFVSKVSKELSDRFGMGATIYSTGADEFSFVFHRKMTDKSLEETAQKITETLSNSYNVDVVSIQQNVLCSFYHCTPDAQENFTQLFCTMDRAMSVAKEQNATKGGNAIVNVNRLTA